MWRWRRKCSAQTPQRRLIADCEEAEGHNFACKSCNMVSKQLPSLVSIELHVLELLQTSEWVQTVMALSQSSKCDGHPLHDLTPPIITAHFITAGRCDFAYKSGNVTSKYLPSLNPTAFRLYEILQKVGYFLDRVLCWFAYCCLREPWISLRSEVCSCTSLRGNIMQLVQWSF